MKIFRNLLYKLIWGRGHKPYLIGVEVLYDNLDPDDVPVNQRAFANVEEIKKNLFEVKPKKIF